ncbi:STAS-like domain-containing protein [Stenotrophomonas sp. C3(2023)]|uniref:STAS-like domain-containing protein n=1 Tax=Stenotrophomonas sp. C3(2023) TaxID=3080277 RepID=UPI00293C91DA|nr:STAS-like domain-containing protein [Stenotrophomonas sp. C3(2023)]MDV3468995.1 STAS-like domain-containing protein [Stenotrophomonas sp. C3(2023)]
MKVIDISRDFSRVPAGRHKIDSDHSGEVFRDNLLAPALRQYEHVKVVLDDTEGFGSSFLEEAFGGLIRYCGFTKDYLASHLTLIAKSPGAMRYPARIQNYILKASNLTIPSNPKIQRMKR